MLSRITSAILTVTALSGLLSISHSPAYGQETYSKRTDTLEVSGRQVVFYALSQIEVDTLKGIQAEAMNEAVADFQLYFPRVTRWLKTVELPCSFITAAVIRFHLSGGRSWIFDRAQATASIGMILTDGMRQPALFPGVDTDSGWIEQIKTYYKLK